jgi:AsmA family
MKITRIIFFTLLALSLIVCSGIFIFLETLNTGQYLPQITKKASLALGRPVSITGVGLGLSLRGITLDAGPVTIADDSDFTTQSFIKVGRVRISLDLRALILQRKIHITDILLQSPQIHFIRSQEGNFNVRSIGKKLYSLPQRPYSFESEKLSQMAKGVRGGEEKPKGEEPLFPAININSIKIQDASISFIDQSQEAPLDIWLTDINASLDFSEANGKVIITDGVIKNFNILKTVLSHTLGVFGMDGFINKLGAQDTVIEKAEAEFSLRDKTVFIDNFLIKTNILEFTAKGPVDQGLNMDMQTMLYLNGDVSAVLVNELDGLKYLMDDSKRIAIDASLKGVIPHLKYKPNKDFRKKGKKTINALFRQLLGA